MSDVDALIQMCLAVPSDATRRGALADWCAENNEPEIETAVRSPRGEEYIRMLYREADALKRPACLRLLWAVTIMNAPRLSVSDMHPDLPLTNPTGRYRETPPRWIRTRQHLWNDAAMRQWREQLDRFNQTGDSPPRVTRSDNTTPPPSDTALGVVLGYAESQEADLRAELRSLELQVRQEAERALRSLSVNARPENPPGQEADQGLPSVSEIREVLEYPPLEEGPK